MKIREIITELRSHPDQNPKVPVVKYLAQIPENERNDTYVSFTSVEKLGINPGSYDLTPVAIYAYTVDCIIDTLFYMGGETGELAPIEELPYAGDKPYANVFKFKGNMIDLQEDDLSIGSDLFNLLHDTFVKEYSKYHNATEAEDIFKYCLKSASKLARVKSPGGIYWYMTYRIAHILAEDYGTTPPFTWSRMFRLMGIDAINDNDGIIHDNEPTQTAFFKLSVIKNNVRLENRWTRKTSNPLKQIKKLPATENDINRMSDKEMEQIVHKIKTGRMQFKLPTILQIAVLQEAPECASYMKFIDEKTVVYLLTHDYNMFISSAIHYLQNKFPKLIAKALFDNKYDITDSTQDLKPDQIAPTVAKELYLISNKKLDLYTRPMHVDKNKRVGAQVNAFYDKKGDKKYDRYDQGSEFS